MLKVFPLSLGYTKVPFGQFYGGLNGWTGLGAMRRMATDKTHPIIVPIRAYLVEHPTVGPILIDTGINRSQAHSHKSYYQGPMGMVLDEDEYLLDPDQELPNQLNRLGYRCQDIQHVILTHLHEDHVGGLLDVAHARVVLPKVEWELRDQRLLGIFPTYYAPSFAMIEDWQFVEFNSGAYNSFDESYDIFGDGLLRLVPTPGHTGGHASVVVQADDYQLFLAGDALYTLHHLAVDQLRAFVFGSGQRLQQYIDSIRRIQALREALPDLVIIPTHDHSDYGNYLIQSALSDGVLSSAEREAIRAYEASVFDQHWHLKAGAVPHYAPARAAHGVGNVVYSNNE